MSRVPWFAASPRMLTEDELAEVQRRFDMVFPCPRLAASEGETMCASCHDDLAWLAAEYLGSLLFMTRSGPGVLSVLSEREASGEGNEPGTGAAIPEAANSQARPKA